MIRSMRLALPVALLALALPAPRSLAAGQPGPGSVTAAAATAAPSPTDLWAAWPDARFVSTPAPCLRPADLDARIEALRAKHQQGLTVEEIGRSAEGRPIRVLSLGRGPRKALAWSQMHGDEPSATPALLDLADYLLAHSDAPAVKTLLERTTLLLVPMLNPDGAERYERRNAQGIDLNRDALSLATPEGRLLEALRERFRPELGFNLHDQNRRTVVGETGRLASIALLAVAGDPEGTLTPGRQRTRRACAAIVRALEPFIPDRITRYDENWSPRAFGDNLTARGTPVVLIESGALPSGGSFEELTRLNFVALASVLLAWATDDLSGHDPALYEALPRNERDAWADVVVSGGALVVPGLPGHVRADLAFDRRAEDRALAGCASAAAARSRIVDVGDARLLGRAREIAAAGGIVVPAWTASVESLAARDWLSGEALARLGALGVRRLAWHVAPQDQAAARAAAEALVGAGRPRVDVVGPGGLSWLRLSGAPATPTGPTLAESLDALAGSSWRPAAPLTFSELLLLLTGAVASTEGFPPEAHAAPGLVPGREASFLLLRPAGDADLDPRRLRVAAVWCDGVELAAP
jgi:hypothetical protein